MENKNLQFKTNLQCGGCVSKVQGELDQALGQGHWQVDTDHADKILTVSASAVAAALVVDIVEGKGFTIAALNAE